MTDIASRRPGMSTDFIVSVHGRRIGRLERVLEAVSGPLWRWRLRRAPHREPPVE